MQSIDPILLQICQNRSISEEDATNLLFNTKSLVKDHKLLHNGDAAADLITSYLKNRNAEIIVFADYDADGITSGFIATDFMMRAGRCKTFVYYPERSEGYGLNMKTCENIVNEQKQTNADVLVVTVDNGITQLKEVEYLQKNNIEVVITDHHLPAEKLPDCIIVDPQLGDEYKYLAGCGVAFKLMQIIAEKIEYKFPEELYLPALAIGTVADVMPMTLENMALVKLGLDIINSPKCPRGIQEMKDYMGVNTLNAINIAWDIAPKLNACGRMGDIKLGAQVFFGDEVTIDSEWADLINTIENLNSKRKKLSANAGKTLDKIKIEDNNAVCIVDGTDFPLGMAGIIANKAMEQFNKPAIVLKEHDGVYKGSVRIPYVIKGIKEMLQSCKDSGLLLDFGGHEQAAGLEIAIDKIEEFKTKIQGLKFELEEREPEELIIDGTITLDQANEKFFNLINAIPYAGKTMPEPLFRLENITITKVKKSGNNPDNICLTFNQGRKRGELWAWKMGQIYEDMGSPEHVTFICKLERDFRNRKNITFGIKEIIGA